MVIMLVGYPFPSIVKVLSTLNVEAGVRVLESALKTIVSVPAKALASSSAALKVQTAPAVAQELLPAAASEASPESFTVKVAAKVAFATRANVSTKAAILWMVFMVFEIMVCFYLYLNLDIVTLFLFGNKGEMTNLICTKEGGSSDFWVGLV